MKRTIFLQIAFAAAAALPFAAVAGAQPDFAPDNGGLDLPSGFRALVVADDIGRARQIAVRGNGDLYVSLVDSVNLSYVAALRDDDGDGRMDQVHYFGELDGSVEGIALHAGHLYLSSPTRVVRYPMSDDGLLPTGAAEVVATGFPFKGADERQGSNQARNRLSGLAVGPDGSMYVSEGETGRIWRIFPVGEDGQAPFARSTSKEPETASAEPVVSLEDLDPKAQRLYDQYCLACHQVDGGGVPSLQPSLLESDKLSGADDYLIRLMLQGSQWVENSAFGNVMTPFQHLSDQEIAQVLNYVKMRFGGVPGSIAAEGVAEMRGGNLQE